MRYLTACSDTMWVGEAVADVSQSCANEFLASDITEIVEATAAIETQLRAEPSDASAEGTFCYLGVRNATADESARLVEIASEALRGLDFVGVLEHMNTTMRAFAAMLGVSGTLPEEEYVVPSGAGSGLEVWTDAQLAVVTERLAPDVRVWCVAVEQLQAAIEAYGVDAAGESFAHDRCDASRELSRASAGGPAGGRAPFWSLGGHQSK
jgi:hypothetical protein